MNGPYQLSGDSITYVGNAHFSPMELRDCLSDVVDDRCTSIERNREYWDRLIRIDSQLNSSLHRFFVEKLGACLVDLPLLTRSISSPGALGDKPAIVSDVRPFVIQYFRHTEPLFLSQSSQLYLEAYILMTSANKVYTVGKSFRNEDSDFRHLTEFRHAECEVFGDLSHILDVQEKMVRFLIHELIAKCEPDVRFFLSEQDIASLDLPSGSFTTMTFDEAFTQLYKATKNSKYDPRSASVLNFDAKAEILLTHLVGDGKPLFVTHYPTQEVAFYHAVSPSDPSRVINADLLFPNYGEVIGSGQRVFSRGDYEHKRDMFRLCPDDYDWYGTVRESSKHKEPHSGFGMGIERFMAAVLKLPSLIHATAFPRVHWAIRP